MFCRIRYKSCCELQVKTEVQRNIPSRNWLTIMIKTVALGNNKSLRAEGATEIERGQFAPD